MSVQNVIRPVEYRKVGNLYASPNQDFVAFVLTKFDGFIREVIPSGLEDDRRLWFVLTDRYGVFFDALEAWERGEQDVPAMFYASRMRIVQTLAKRHWLAHRNTPKNEAARQQPLSSEQADSELCNTDAPIKRSA